MLEIIISIDYFIQIPINSALFCNSNKFFLCFRLWDIGTKIIDRAYFNLPLVKMCFCIFSNGKSKPAKVAIEHIGICDTSGAVTLSSHKSLTFFRQSQREARTNPGIRQFSVVCQVLVYMLLKDLDVSWIDCMSQRQGSAPKTACMTSRHFWYIKIVSIP